MMPYFQNVDANDSGANNSRLIDSRKWSSILASLQTGTESMKKYFPYNCWKACLLAAGLLAVPSALLFAQMEMPEPANNIAKQGGVRAVDAGRLGFDGRPEDPSKAVVVQIESPENGAFLQGDSLDVFVKSNNFRLAPGGNRIQVALDNRRSELVYDTAQPVTFKNLGAGGHTLRAFAVGGNGVMSKDASAFVMRQFYVREKNLKNIPSPEEPILTVSSPRALVYKGEDARLIHFDYRIGQAALSESGFRLRYSLDGRSNMTWASGPVYWPALKNGVHRLIAEVVDPEGQPVPGIFNRVEVAFTVEESPLPPPVAAPLATGADVMATEVVAPTPP